MSEERPKLSSAKVTLAILGAIALLFVGCIQIATRGGAFDVRGNDELFGGLCLAAGVALAFWLYRIAFKSTPSFVLHSDRIEFYGRPTYFSDVAEIVSEPGQIWLRRAPQLALRLNNGSIQHLPYGLMTHGPGAFADLLKDAIDRYRAEEAGQQTLPHSSSVTGP